MRGGMSDPADDRASRMYLLSKAVLIAGLVCAVAIFLRATLAAPGHADYQLEETKQYQRQMELYGGKANVMASDVREWLGTLWHGKRLAYSVAALSVVAAGIIRFAAIPLPPLDGGDDDEPDDRPAS